MKKNQDKTIQAAVLKKLAHEFNVTRSFIRMCVNGGYDRGISDEVRARYKVLIKEANELLAS